MKNDWLRRIEETSSYVDGGIVSMDILLDGESISHVGIREREILVYGCRTIVGCIGGVATKPEYRNRGLATRLMESSIRRINEDDGDIMFISGGRGLYRRLGCVDAGELGEFTVKRSSSLALTGPRIALRPYREEYMVKIVSAYQQEPVRFHRPLADFKEALHRHPVPLWMAPDVLMMEHEDEFWGYLCIQESKKKEGREPGHGYISEYAGDRRAVISAIPALFDQYDFNDLQFWVARHDTAFIRMLSEYGGIECLRRNLMGHTFKLVNFPRLMQRFRPYLEERVGVDMANALEFTQKGESCTIRLGDKVFPTDDRSIALIVFGSCDGRERELIPQNRTIAKVLDAIFPLPFIWPGLDSF